MCILRKVEEVWKTQAFHDELNGDFDMYSAGDLVVCLGDLNGHFGRYIDGFGGVHGVHGIGQRNLEMKNDIRFLWRMNYVCQIHCL